MTVKKFIKENIQIIASGRFTPAQVRSAVQAINLGYHVRIAEIDDDFDCCDEFDELVCFPCYDLD